jgi:hypothetical protein
MAVIKQICEEPDQTQKRQRDERAHGADSNRQRGDRQDAKRGRKIPQLFISGFCFLASLVVSRTSRFNVILLSLVHVFFPNLSGGER